MIQIKHPLCPTNICNNFQAVNGNSSFSEGDYIAFDVIGDASVCQLYEPTLLLNDGSGWETTLHKEKFISSHTIIGLDETNYGVFGPSVNINAI